MELVRTGFEALNRGDRATVARLLAPDVEWHSLAGPIVGVGTIRGREAMLRFWQDVLESIEGFRASPEEVTDLGDDRVLVVARYEGRGRTSDAEVDQRIASCLRDSGWDGCDRPRLRKQDRGPRSRRAVASRRKGARLAAAGLAITRGIRSGPEGDGRAAGAGSEPRPVPKPWRLVPLAPGICLVPPQRKGGDTDVPSLGREGVPKRKSDDLGTPEPGSSS